MSITDHQIETLRTEAAEAGDWATVACCNAALDSWPQEYEPSLRASCEHDVWTWLDSDDVEGAKQVLKGIIAEAQAMADSD